MKKDELDFSIQIALRKEFETADQERAVEIYETAKQLKLKETAEEMKQEIEIDFNIKL